MVAQKLSESAGFSSYLFRPPKEMSFLPPPLQGRVAAWEHCVFLVAFLIFGE